MFCQIRFKEILARIVWTLLPLIQIITLPGNLRILSIFICPFRNDLTASLSISGASVIRYFD